MINLIKMAGLGGQLEGGSQNQLENQENVSVSQDLNDLQGQAAEFAGVDRDMEDEIRKAYESDPELVFYKKALKIDPDPRKVNSWNPDVLNNLSE